MSVFDTVKGLAPGRSVFDLSWEKKFTCDMGELIPVCHDLMVPGDVFDIGYQVLVRAQPMAAPLMHPIYITGHFFFVSIRALCDYMRRQHSETFDWEEFITGGEDGTDSQTIPTWNPGAGENAEGTLWDYLCYPLGVDNANAYPTQWKHWSYGWIWNEYYRDQNITAEADPDDVSSLKRAAWEKDYFTSCLPWQQRGTAPAVSGSLDWTITANAMTNTTAVDMDAGGDFTNASDADMTLFVAALEAGDVTSLDIADLRLASSIQRYMELSARAGSRYKEHLEAFFGVSPRDERLNRPVYIGGFKDWLITSEVLQTESSDASTPQGTMAGHGIMVGSGHIGKYRALEHGVLFGMFTIRPKTLYHQGIDRQDLQDTRYDYYNPMFAGLSEQEVLTREIYCDGVDELTVFGYQGRYDEYRYRPSRVCGDMHADYDMWHMCRQFGAAPTLNDSFIFCDPRDDWKASSSEDGFIVSFGNRIRAIRPMPFRAQPGMGVL